MTTYSCSVSKEDEYLVIVFDLALYQHMGSPTYLVPSTSTDEQFMCRWMTPQEPISIDHPGFRFEYISEKPTIAIHSSAKSAQWFINKGLPSTYQAEANLQFLLKLWKAN